MACKCCKQFAPKLASMEPGAKVVILADPVAPCAGDAAIEEARDWARTWKERAQQAGWRPGWTEADQKAMDQIKADMDAPEEDGWTNKPRTPFSPDVDEEKPAGPVQACDHSRKRAYDRKDRRYCCDCGGTIEQCTEHGFDLCDKPCPVCEAEPRGPALDATRLIMDGPSGKGVKYPHERTLREKMADHLAEAIAAGEEIAYCQGPERHHAIVGSPMHDQLVERGCFHCDAFPEVAA